MYPLDKERIQYYYYSVTIAGFYIRARKLGLGRKMMSLKNYKLSAYFLFYLFFSCIGSQASALDCSQVKQLVSVFLKVHFSFHSFDDELSRRTLENFIKNWDPGKVYFLESDVKRFESSYSDKLDDMIKGADCKAIDDIMNIYSARFSERQKVIVKDIDDPHDFTVDEYLDIDRKNMLFAKTIEEVNERWRKRVKFQLLQLKSTISDLKEARAKMHKRYELALKRHNETNSDDVYASFLNSFASALDPHSDYMSPEDLEDFRIYTKLSLEGIGAVLRSEDGFTTVQSLVPGGAAAKTGKIKIDDKIIAVAQGKEPPVDVIDMELREVVKLIRGPRGTEVQLTLMREEGGKTVKQIIPVIREQVTLEDKAASSKVFDVVVKDPVSKKETVLKIGDIDLPSFYMDFEGRQANEKDYRSSSADMIREIESLKKKGIDGLIVDLRNNGGGSLDEAINVAGLFFDKGPVVQIKGMESSLYVQSDKDEKVYYDGPLVVLANRLSASASEILAGAIQDYGRGPIVGDTHTFGKGTVQNLNDIAGKLGAIKVTISKFYRPSGASTQLRGVESDVVLPDILEEYEIGEKHYDYALPWEKIAPTDYKKFHKVTPYVAAIAKSSKERLASDQQYKKVLDEIKKYKDNAKERYHVSLKEKKEEEQAEKNGDKSKKSEENLGDRTSEKPPLKDDPFLQESLRIAADYVSLLNKKPLGTLTIPTLEKELANVADGKKENAKSKSPVTASEKAVQAKDPPKK